MGGGSGVASFDGSDSSMDVTSANNPLPCEVLKVPRALSAGSKCVTSIRSPSQSLAMLSES